MINIYGVNKRLKQRPPFQMIEKVTELVPGQSATGVKTVSDNFKFLKPVLPGDVMVVSVAKKSGAGPLVTFEATVTVDGQIRSKGNLSFTAIDRAGLDGENND